MKRKVFITYIPVNSRMWAPADHADFSKDASSIEELKTEILQEDVEFVNFLDNLALVNFLKEEGVEVTHKERKQDEKKDLIIANPGDVIYELFGNFSCRKDKQEEENLPKFTTVVVRRWEYKKN